MTVAHTYTNSNGSVLKIYYRFQMPIVFITNTSKFFLLLFSLCVFYGIAYNNLMLLTVFVLNRGPYFIVFFFFFFLNLV